MARLIMLAVIAFSFTCVGCGEDTPVNEVTPNSAGKAPSGDSTGFESKDVQD